MKVYKQVCDRCANDFAPPTDRPYELILTAKYYPDDRRTMFANRHKLELCEDCRVKFGEWIGTGRKNLPGLVSEVEHPEPTPQAPPPEPGPVIPAQASFRVLVLTKLGETRNRPPPGAPPSKPPRTTVNSQEL